MSHAFRAFLTGVALLSAALVGFLFDAPPRVLHGPAQLPLDVATGDICFRWEQPLAALRIPADPTCSLWWGGRQRVIDEIEPAIYYTDPMWSEEETP